MDGTKCAEFDAYIRDPITAFLSVLAVSLRFIARIRSNAGYGLDDAFIVAAVVSFLVVISVELWSTRVGLPASSDPELPLPILVDCLKALMVNTIFTILTISFAKLSVLALYHRIFSINTSFRNALIAVTFVTIAWMIAAFFAFLFRCDPVQAAWDPLIIKTSHCYSLETMFAVTESINCATEVVLVIMPMFLLKGLQLPLRHKIGLSVIFLLGGFVAVASILRIIFTYNPSAVSSSVASSGMWIDIQLCCAIVCACLPTFRPIIPKFRALASNFTSPQSIFGQRSKVNGSTLPRTESVSSNEMQTIRKNFKKSQDGYLSDETSVAEVGKHLSFSFEEELDRRRPK